MPIFFWKLLYSTPWSSSIVERNARNDKCLLSWNKSDTNFQFFLSFKYSLVTHLYRATYYTLYSQLSIIIIIIIINPFYQGGFWCSPGSMSSSRLATLKKSYGSSAFVWPRYAAFTRYFVTGLTFFRLESSGLSSLRGVLCCVCVPLNYFHHTHRHYYTPRSAGAFCSVYFSPQRDFIFFFSPHFNRKHTDRPSIKMSQWCVHLSKTNIYPQWLKGGMHTHEDEKESPLFPRVPLTCPCAFPTHTLSSSARTSSRPIPLCCCCIISSFGTQYPIILRDFCVCFSSLFFSWKIIES